MKPNQIPQWTMMRYLVLGPLSIAIIAFAIMISTACSQSGFNLPQNAGLTRDYNYVGSRYQPSGAQRIINTPLDATSLGEGTIEAAHSFVEQSMSFGAWREFNSPGAGGVGFGVVPRFRLSNPFLQARRDQVGFGSRQRPEQWRVLRLGPFYVDSIALGSGVLYADYQGTPFGIQPSQTGTDNFAMVTWASMRLTAFISDRFAITLQPSVYWLPLENEVGWALGSPFISLGATAAPQSILQMAYRTPIANEWELNIFDQFHASFLNNSFLDENIFLQAGLLDMTPIDRAGRYRFGGSGASQFDALGRTDFSLNNQLFGRDQLFFQNYAGVSLLGRHAGSLRSSLFYNRLDTWDSGFDHRQAWNRLGGMLVKEGPVFTPYTFSQFTTQDDFKTWVGHAVLGANINFSPTVVGYGQVGWLWAERGFRGDYDTWIALAGFRQSLGPYTDHGVEGGRSPTDLYGTQFVSDFIRYYIRQRLGPNMVAGWYVQNSDLTYLTGPGVSSRHLLTSGALLLAQLTERTQFSLFASYNDVDLEDVSRGWKMWTYRASLSHGFSPTVRGLAVYQYQDAGSGVGIADDFTENMVFVGIEKRF